MFTGTLQILIDCICKIIITKICQRLRSKMTFCSFSLDLFLAKFYRATLKPMRLIIWDYSFWIEYFKDLKIDVANGLDCFSFSFKLLWEFVHYWNCLNSNYKKIKNKKLKNKTLLRTFSKLIKFAVYQK